MPAADKMLGLPCRAMIVGYAHLVDDYLVEAAVHVVDFIADAMVRCAAAA